MSGNQPTPPCRSPRRLGGVGESAGSTPPAQYLHRKFTDLALDSAQDRSADSRVVLSANLAARPLDPKVGTGAA